MSGIFEEEFPRFTAGLVVLTPASIVVRDKSPLHLRQHIPIRGRGLLRRNQPCMFLDDRARLAIRRCVIVIEELSRISFDR